MEDEEEVITYEDIAWLTSLIVNSQFRIYDVLISILAASAGSEKAKQLQEMHEEGKFLFPPPHIYTDGEE
jgi:hypothetical protein